MLKKLNLNKIVTFILLFLVIGVPIVVASIDFFPKAKIFIDKNCTNSKVSNETALLCYLYFKSNNIDQRLTLLENKPSPTVVPSPTKQLKVYDGNENELGLYIDGDTTGLNIFLPSIQKRLSISPHFEMVGIGSTSVREIVSVNVTDRSSVIFESNDCSGIAYGENYYNTVTSMGPGKYYATKQNSSLQQIHQRSILHFDNVSSLLCSQEERNPSRPVYELEEVLLPFSEPIQLPIKILYQ